MLLIGCREDVPPSTWIQDPYLSASALTLSHSSMPSSEKPPVLTSPALMAMMLATPGRCSSRSTASMSSLHG